MAGCSAVLAGSDGWGNVHPGVAVEEVGGLELEADVLYRHDGEVLHPDRMGDAEAVPDNRVIASHGAILQGGKGALFQIFATTKDKCLGDTASASSQCMFADIVYGHAAKLVLTRARPTFWFAAQQCPALLPWREMTGVQGRRSF